MEDQYLVWLKENFQPNLISLEDLEDHFSFTFIPQISFASRDIHFSIKKKLKQKTIEDKHLQAGNLFAQEILSKFYPKVSVRWVSEQTQYGLYTEEELPIGSYIGEYTGQVRENNHHTNFNHYLYKYPLLDDIDRHYVIDAKDGNLTRFINHSYSPNLKPIYAYCNGLYHLIFIAVKNIRKGEQLFYDYGVGYWNLRGQPEKL